MDEHSALAGHPCEMLVGGYERMAVRFGRSADQRVGRVLPALPTRRGDSQHVEGGRVRRRVRGAAVLRTIAASSAKRVAKLCTGWPSDSPSCRVCEAAFNVLTIASQHHQRALALINAIHL